jgi:Mn-containing catalase
MASQGDALVDLREKIQAEVSSRTVSKRRLLAMMMDMYSMFETLSMERDAMHMLSMLEKANQSGQAVAQRVGPVGVFRVTDQQKEKVPDEPPEDYRAGHYLAYL